MASVLALAAAIGTAALESPVDASTGTLSITTDTTLAEDHYGSIVIDADNVTLDCAGHQVIGLSTGTGVGVVLDGRSGVTVRDCHVMGGISGGFDLSGGSSDNTLSGNTVTGFAHAGFSLTNGANNNRLTGNAASGGVHGFWLEEVRGNVLRDNHASGNGFQLGNGLGTNTTGNMLIGNTSSDAPYSGFNLYGATGNVLLNNRATDNGYDGFEAQQASDNNFSGNVAMRNEHCGFAVNTNLGGADGSEIFDGANARGNKFQKNVSNHNHECGFAANQANDNAFSSNVATGNRLGFTVDGGNGNVFVRDVSNHNGEFGFALWAGSSGNVVDRSVAHANGVFDATDYNAPGSNTWTSNRFGTTDPAGIG